MSGLSDVLLTAQPREYAPSDHRVPGTLRNALLWIYAFVVATIIMWVVPGDAEARSHQRHFSSRLPTSRRKDRRPLQETIV
jgi:hypothetical protein